MPTVNIYYTKPAEKTRVVSLIPKLRQHLVIALTCGDIRLTPEEISIRLIRVEKGTMIGSVELEIHAHAFKERVKKQDDICRNLIRFLETEKIKNPKAWIVLSELGHSW